MTLSLRRLAAVILCLPLIAFTLRGQVVMSDDFETDSVGAFPAGWTQQAGTSALMFVVDNPVKFGARAFRVASAISQTHTAKFTTAISNDYFYDYYIFIPDSGQLNETKGSVKVEGVGMQFGLGTASTNATVFFSTAADGWIVPSNEWHHVQVEVDYQKNVARVTLNDSLVKKYMVTISTSQDVRVEATSVSTILQSHALYVDSLTVSTGTIDLTPAGPTLTNPSDNAVGEDSPIFFSWNSISQQTGYNIQISTDSTFQSGIVVNDTTLSTTSTNIGIPPLATATDYFWRLRAKNTVGWGEWSVVRRFRSTDPPTAPVLYSPSENFVMTSTDQLYSYWSAPSGAVGYHLQVAEDSNFTVFVINDSALTNSYIYLNHPPLQINKTYYWRVRAVGAAGWGPFAQHFTFKTLQPPNAPALSSPANATVFYDLDDVYHSWGSVGSASAYHLQISEDSAFTMIVHSDTNVTITSQYVAHPPLEPNKTYYWRVRAKNVVGWGTFSSFRKYTTMPVPMTVILSSPSNASVQSGSDIDFFGYVSYPETADSFRVQIASDTNFTSLIVDTVVGDAGSLSVLMSNFGPGATYYWRMSGHNAGGFGPFSARRSFSISTLPAAPAPSAPTDNVETSSIPVFVDWSSVTSAIQYQVQIATDSLFTSLVLDSLVSSSFANVSYPPLAFNQAYYWRVRARTNVGWGPYSVVWRFSTPTSPTTPVLTSPAPGTTDLLGNVLFTWVSSPNKDTTFIEITTDTNSVPSRTFGGGGKARTSAMSFWRLARYYYDYMTIDITSLVGMNTQAFVRLQDHNDAGFSPFSPWIPIHTQRPPAPPTGILPVNGATNVPFSNLLISVDENLVSNVAFNLSAQQTNVLPEPPPILLNAPMYQGSIFDDEIPQGSFFRTINSLETNATYEFTITAYNPAGTVTSPVFTFTTADPSPVLHCSGDVLFDQGGFVNLELISSGSDYGECPTGSSSSPSCVYQYYGWRLWLPTELPAWDLRRIEEEVEKVPEKFRTAAMDKDTIYIWEPLFFFPAVGRPSYLLSVRTVRDSANGRPYVERYMITAHSGTGRYWCSNIVTGYSVDNLAPEPPVGGVASLDNGSVRVVWTANDEPDLKDYTIYRSLSASDDVKTLVPIGTTSQPVFVDADPPQVQTAYYYVVANDKNGNTGNPAIIEATIVTGVDGAGGIPTEYNLGQNYPNPFNPSTTIQFGLPKESRVELQVLNMLGQVIQTVIQDVRAAGYHRVTWQGNVPSGLYLYRIIATPADGSGDRFTSIRKMVLLK